MREYKTSVENEFERLRVAMLKDGYLKEHRSLQLLACLRTSLKVHGYRFQLLDQNKDTRNV